MIKSKILLMGRFLELIIITLLLANVFFLANIYFDKIKQKNNFIDLKKLERIKILTPAGEEKYLSATLKTEESYVLFFKLNDCPACIYKGLYELKQLEQARKLTLAITIHEWVDEWKAWVKNIEVDNIYFLKKSDIEDIINFPYTPILIKMKKGHLKNYKYISS